MSIPPNPVYSAVLPSPSKRLRLSSPEDTVVEIVQSSLKSLSKTNRLHWSYFPSPPTGIWQFDEKYGVFRYLRKEEDTAGLVGQWMHLSFHEDPDAVRTTGILTNFVMARVATVYARLLATMVTITERPPEWSPSQLAQPPASAYGRTSGKIVLREVEDKEIRQLWRLQGATNRPWAKFEFSLSILGKTYTPAPGALKEEEAAASSNAKAYRIGDLVVVKRTATTEAGERLKTIGKVADISKMGTYLLVDLGNKNYRSYQNGGGITRQLQRELVTRY